MHTTSPIDWTPQGVRMLDQRRLPTEVVYHTYTSYQDVATAITDMVIRGAPAIGVAAAMGLALGIERSAAKTLLDLHAEFNVIAEVLLKTRPTAVDLFWAVDRMTQRFEQAFVGSARMDPPEALAAMRKAMVEEAQAIHAEKKEIDAAIGRFGAELMPREGKVMTQCNAGALATAGYGTALGVFRWAVFEQGRKLHVVVPETRPYLQGARLTAWELQQDGIPLTLITDSMVGYTLKCGEVGAIVVGADRIAANGDTANKIGTYQMALLAHEHGVPFYVAAPISTLDLSIPNGNLIPIEQRAAEEITHLQGVRIAPDVPVSNPAFDVTPARLIAAIFTERGVARPPFSESLAALVETRV